MDIYYYCSYTGSPVGYILGLLTYNPNRSSNYILSRKNIPSVIRRFFEYDTICNAFGILPVEPKQYYLMMKNLTAKGNKDDEASEYYINLALVTQNVDEYKRWLRDGSRTTTEIADMVKASMELDRTSDFGFTVRPDKLKKLVDASFRSIFEGSGALERVNTFLEVDSPQTNLTYLAENLELSDPEKTLSFLSEAPKWVVYSKKKQTRPIHPIVVIPAAAGILAAFIWILRTLLKFLSVK